MVSELAPQDDSALFLAATAAFDQVGWNYDRVPGREVLELNFEAHHTSVPVHVQVFGELKAVSVVAGCSVAVAKPKFPLIAEALMRTNLELNIGNFELDYDSGRAYFRATNLFASESDAPPILANLVHTSVAEVDRITPFLHKLANANPLEIADLNLKRFLKRTDLLPPAPDAAAGEP
ncbi:MAG: hypothetical protein KDN05_16050 [Verrucomicrobiae bacterium]|nr:hypothetical protein [Verrucomicrobiae bacterium]